MTESENVAAVSHNALNAVSELIRILQPLVREERDRAISAARMLLGDDTVPTKFSSRENPEVSKGLEGMHSKAETWMTANSVSGEELDQTFAIDGNSIEIIGTDLPASTKTQQTIQVYLLSGLRAYLASGELNFSDEDARELCQKAGCYDKTNHAKWVRNFGNLISGSKEAGWKITHPGLREAAKIVKTMASKKAA